MPARNLDLHGNVPDRSAVVLLLIDLINDYSYPGGDKLLKHTRAIAPNILHLRAAAREARVPTIYVNDNFGHWQSDFNKVLRHCLADDVPGCDITCQLRPAEDDYFVLKPKHSGFYSTSLDILLDYLQAQTLVLAGIAGDSCVLFTANDAYMRDFRLLIPGDCIASQDSDENQRILEQMERVLKADIRPAADIDFQQLAALKAALPTREAHSER